MSAPSTAQVLENAAQAAAHRYARIAAGDARLRSLAHACQPITTPRTAAAAKRGA